MRIVSYRGVQMCDFLIRSCRDVIYRVLFLFFIGVKSNLLSYLRHSDLYPVFIAGIPSFALHTCLETVVTT